MIEPTSQPVFTSPHQSEEAQGRFIKILESTTDLVLMADRDGHTLYLNKAGRDMLGWGAQDAPEQIPISEILPAWAYAIVSEHAMPTAFANGSWSGETALLTRSGKEIPVLQVLLAHTGKDNEVEFFSTICRDISDRKQKEVEQIEWSNRYDAAIRASGQALFDWDSTTGGISYAGALHRVTGYEPEELSGGIAQLRSLIHPDDREKLDIAVEDAISMREGIRAEFRLNRKDDREITVKMEGRFFIDRQGRIGRMVGFLSDVTAERIYERGVQLTQERLEQSVAGRTKELKQAYTELQESARQQEAVARLGRLALEGVPIAVLMTEAVDVIRSALHAECASVNEWHPEADGFICNAHSGWPMGPALAETHAGTRSQSGYTIMTGLPVMVADYETETRFIPSEACQVANIRSALTTPIHAGKLPFGVLGAFSTKTNAFGPEDISFLQNVSNILSAAVQRLRAEGTAHRAQGEAEAANRAKSEFLSRMSHELRTPLNAILGFSQLLEMEEHNERQAESIDHIARAGRNLLMLINEVLDIARLDSGRIKIEHDPVEIAPLLEELVSYTQTLAAPQRISIRLTELAEKNPVVIGDRERLKQVFLNLLSNAVKYNRPEGLVTITIAPSGVDYWKISVTDTGPGIPAESLSLLFVPFERLGQREGGTEGGTGLGLTLCQRLVKALEGRIGVASTVGVGSTFWVELPALVSINVPAEPEVSITAPSAPAPIAEDKVRTLLYVEDDLANLSLLERIIETRKNLKCVACVRGGLALDLARKHRPTLILLDLNLPDMTGEALFAQLKADPEMQHIPVIIVTGEINSDRSENLLRDGAVDILSKPYRIQDLFAMIDAHTKA